VLQGSISKIKYFLPYVVYNFYKLEKKNVYVSFHKLNQIQVTMTSVNLILDAAQILEDEEEKHNNIVTWNTPINPQSDHGTNQK